MGVRTLSGEQLARMAVFAQKRLEAHAGEIDALNVFPVPDGDTGTNMSLTWKSGVEEMLRNPTAHTGKAAEALAKGLLMGARGNSGVILSQLFRGFSKAVATRATLTARQFAFALQQGVETACRSVLRPVEGTMLTVAREAAAAATAAARRTDDLAEVLTQWRKKAQEALAATPEQLPLLKQAGVVDAGGRGFVELCQAFCEALENVETPEESVAARSFGRPALDRDVGAAQAHGDLPAPARVDGSSIAFGYCTEFLLRLDSADKGRKSLIFHEDEFRVRLEQYGDSVVVVADDGWVKAHLHTETPLEVLAWASGFGELDRVKIENMRLQHERLAKPKAEQDARGSASAGSRARNTEGSMAARAEPEQAVRAAGSTAASTAPSVLMAVPDAGADSDKPPAPCGLVAVVPASALADMFRSLGVDAVVDGGPTMNPSTEQIVRAVSGVRAETVFVLPNHPNVEPVVRQAVEWIVDRKVEIMPARTIPQGLAAAVAFARERSADENRNAMERAAGGVRSGHVAIAVRDSTLDGRAVRKDQYLGFADGKLVAVSDRLESCCLELVGWLVGDGCELLTVLVGADAAEEETGRLLERLKASHPRIETEVRYGGQPFYPYVFAAE